MIKIGLDVGTDGVRAVEADFSTKKPVLLNRYISNSLKATLFSENKNDIEECASFFKDFFNENSFKSNNVIVGIPESKVFTKIIEMAEIPKSDVAKAIKWEAEQYIPDNIDEFSFQFQILPDYGVHTNAKNEKRKIEVLFIAVKKKILNKYLETFERANLNVLAMEPTSMALSRAFDYSQGLILVAVNIGYDSTDIVVVENDLIRFTRSIAHGTETLIRSLSKEINLSESQAKTYIESYGLDEKKLDGKVFEIINPVMEIIVGEIKRSIEFYEKKKAFKKVQKVVISGSGSTIAGLLYYLSLKLGALEIELSNPWNKFENSHLFNKDDELNDKALYSVACGLCLKPV